MQTVASLGSTDWKLDSPASILWLALDDFGQVVKETLPALLARMGVDLGVPPNCPMFLSVVVENETSKLINPANVHVHKNLLKEKEVDCAVVVATCQECLVLDPFDEELWVGILAVQPDY